jgi:hypothetical protein
MQDNTEANVQTPLDRLDGILSSLPLVHDDGDQVMEGAEEYTYTADTLSSAQATKVAQHALSKLRDAVAGTALVALSTFGYTDMLPMPNAGAEIRARVSEVFEGVDALLNRIDPEAGQEELREQARSLRALVVMAEQLPNTESLFHAMRFASKELPPVISHWVTENAVCPPDADVEEHRKHVAELQEQQTQSGIAMAAVRARIEHLRDGIKVCLSVPTTMDISADSWEELTDDDCSDGSSSPDAPADQS